MANLKFNSATSFKKIITLNGQKFEHFDLCKIPNKFGCRSYGDADGIYQFINYKGLTYYQKD